MTMYRHKGYQRLAIAIPALVFAGSLMFFWGTTEGERTSVILLAMPMVAAVFAAGAYALIRLIYWVLDGFRQ